MPKDKYSDIGEWVKAVSDSSVTELRQAIHTLFIAIAEQNSLREQMVIKGGVLLAVMFKSSRFTMDVDFSTENRYADVDIEKFLTDLSEGLAMAVEELDYGLDCKIQSHEVKPAREDAIFQTITIKIGYAYKGTKKHKKLASNNCPTVLKVDYSFNEQNYKIGLIKLGRDKSIKAYSIVDIVGEKYRAMIQQKVRNRKRRQDAYDIFWLLKNGYLEAETLKVKVHKSLIAKSESRGLEVSRNSLDDEEIKKRSQADFKTLQQEIDEPLPDFEKCYEAVKKYYKSLPWK